MANAILLCLHGWGGSSESFTELKEALKGAPIDILTPDLPGFGTEPDPPVAWTTDDYVDWVIDWLQKQMGNEKRANEQREKFLLLGHSHGGRIAIKLASRQSSNEPTRNVRITRLFLCAAAGIRHNRHMKRIIGLMLAKTGKFFLAVPGIRLLQPTAKKLLYRLVRVHDYERASPVMRQTLINVSREDLTPLLPLVSIPTDIFWGENDHMTPVSDAYLMEKLIPGSRLHLFPGVRHRVHRERAREISEVIRNALPGVDALSAQHR